MNVLKETTASKLLSKIGDKYKYYNFFKPSDDVYLETRQRREHYTHKLLHVYKCLETVTNSSLIIDTDEKILVSYMRLPVSSECCTVLTCP